MKKRRLKPLKDRFEDKFIPEPNSGCWLWTAGVNQRGYGKMKIKGRVVYAHRVAWSLMVGKIPRNRFICHHCDTPACVNPRHLFIGTSYDNMRDMVKKGRHRGSSVRRSVCNSGAHRLEGDNILVLTDGKRRCNACYRARIKIRNMKLRKLQNVQTSRS